MSISSNYSNYYNYYNSNNYVSTYFPKRNLEHESKDEILNKINTTALNKNSLLNTISSNNSNNDSNIDFSGMVLMNLLKLANKDTSNSSNDSQTGDNSTIKIAADKVKTDMDNIKTVDVDSMSAEEIKTTLTNLKNDMDAIPKPYGGKGNSQEQNLDNLSESDLKDMLKKVQERAINAPDMSQPPEPPEFDMVQIINKLSQSSEDTDPISFNSDIDSVLRQIVNKLTKLYDSSAESSNDYVTSLKTSLTSEFDKEKAAIDKLSSLIFSSLDKWSNEETADTTNITDTTTQSV